MTLKSEVKSELKSELMSQETQYKKLSGNLGSWVAGIETMTLKSEVKSELMSQETQYKKPIKFNI